MSDLRQVCDKLAAVIAEESSREGVKLQERIDAFKVLVGYFSALQRAKSGDSPERGNDFKAFELLLNGHEVPDDETGTGETGIRAGTG